MTGKKWLDKLIRLVPYLFDILLIYIGIRCFKTKVIYAWAVVFSVYNFELLSREMNYKRLYRSRQILPVLAAPVFAVAGSLWMLFKFSFNSILPIQLSFEVIFKNILLMLLYIPVKIILLAVFPEFFGKKAVIETMSGKFYEYDETYGAWFLKDQHRYLRTLVRVLTFMFALTTVVYFVAVCRLGEESEWYLSVYPCAFLIILNEIYYYLNGYTKEEYEIIFMGEDAVAFDYGNYHRMKEILKKVFPGAYLLSHTGSGMTRSEGSKLYIDDLIASEDQVLKNTGLYFANLKDEYNQYNNDLIRSTIAMMKNENTLIFNSFYRDLSEYLYYPIFEHLLNNHRVLVILGKDSLADDVLSWLKDMTSAYCRTGYLFKVGIIDGNREEDYDIGIIRFSNVYDINTIKNNEEWLSQVNFVLGIETSRLLSTAQIFLSVLMEKINVRSETVYCFLDHYSEGLPDTLSHVFHINLTNVVASFYTKGIYTIMDWKANGDFRRQELFNKEMHYLGNGTEIAATALKNQVKNVQWYAETKAPLNDIRWIIRNYYLSLTKYANLHSTQNSYDSLLQFVPELWNTRQQKQTFLIAEDEENNVFTTVRNYMDRGLNQCFINVLSENYLLRDYFNDNYTVFINDPKAISSITPDYFKTERNAVSQLIVELAAGEVSKEHIAHELNLLGFEAEYPVDTLEELIAKYTGVTEPIINETIHERVDEYLETHEDLYYSITEETFNIYFARTLKRAYFVVENEEFENASVDTRLFGHIPQMVMPQQLLTYNGKLYRVLGISDSTGCILRRASDMYLGREYYRQNRTYTIDQVKETVRSRTVMGMEINKISCVVSVKSSGYLVMSDVNDINSAKYVDLSRDSSIQSYDRSYVNKNVLEIKLKDLPENVRLTLVLLLQESFRTLFPNVWQYIGVVSNIDDYGIFDKYLYHFEGDTDKDAIYIIEDSDIDLGILEAIDANIVRIMEIITDYADWHNKKINEPELIIEIPESTIAAVTDSTVREKEGVLRRFINWIKSKLARKPEATGETATEGEDDPAKEAVAEERKPTGKEDNEPETVKDGRTRYQREGFLNFGFEEVSKDMLTEELVSYLRKIGFTGSDLKKAREREIAADNFIDSEEIGRCDFCNRPLTGVSYQRLADGRIRCQECTNTAINTVAEFAEIFTQCKLMLETTYDIAFTVPIAIYTADAGVINKRRGAISTDWNSTGRTLGYAQYKNGQYTIWIENGSPRLAAIETIMHELVHIWQFSNWDKKAFAKIYGNKGRLVVYEGMAVWASIQMLYVLGETNHAGSRERQYMVIENEYGEGFRKFVDKYGMIRDGSVPVYTPFKQKYPL